jgi:hypothetical protein
MHAYAMARMSRTLVTSLSDNLSYLQLTSFLFLLFTGFLNRRDFYRLYWQHHVHTVVGNRQHEPSMIQSFNICRDTWQDVP